MNRLKKFNNGYHQLEYSKLPNGDYAFVLVFHLNKDSEKHQKSDI